MNPGWAPQGGSTKCFHNFSLNASFIIFEYIKDFSKTLGYFSSKVIVNGVQCLKKYPQSNHGWKVTIVEFWPKNVKNCFKGFEPKWSKVWKNGQMENVHEFLKSTKHFY